MNDEPFGRQPLPTVITITGGQTVDRREMSNLISRYLKNQIDLVETSGGLSAEVIRCYPRAVND